MYKVRIADIQKVHHIESNSDFLDVTVQIVQVLSEEERKHTITAEDLDANPGLYRDVEIGDVVEFAEEMVVDTRKHALDPSSSKEEVEEMAQKVLDTFVSEKEIAERNKENEKINKNVQSLQESLVGSELEPKESKE